MPSGRSLLRDFVRADSLPEVQTLLGIGGGGAGVVAGRVGVYADLPTDLEVAPVDSLFVVESSSGVTWWAPWQRRYPGGLYQRIDDTGTLADWLLIGDQSDADDFAADVVAAVTGQLPVAALADAAAHAASLPLEEAPTADSFAWWNQSGGPFLSWLDAAQARDALGLQDASQAEMETGTETARRTVTPQRVAQAIAALAELRPEWLNPSLTGFYDVAFADRRRRVVATLTADLTISTSGRAQGREVELFLTGGASSHALSWPAWTWVQGAPANLAAGKRLWVRLVCTGTTEASVFAVYAVEV